MRRADMHAEIFELRKQRVGLRKEVELLREEVDALRDWILGDPGVSYGPASFRAFQAIPSYTVPSSRKGQAADAVEA